MKRFNSVCLITRDVQKLRGFYRDVLQVDPEGDDIFTTLSTPGATLSLFTEQGMEQMAPDSMRGSSRGGGVLEFEVQDVDHEYQRLTHLDISIVKPPTTQPWGVRSVWFRDPDGNLINFYAKLDDNKQTAPAAIRVREATLADASAIVKLIGEHAASSGEQTPIIEAYVATYLANSTSRILLAEVQNRVVGLLSYSIRPDLFHAGSSCLLEELVVEEVTRGQGVGSALVSELFSRLSSLSCAEVSVAVMFTNRRAIEFYQAHGLTEEALYLEKHYKREG